MATSRHLIQTLHPSNSSNLDISAFATSRVAAATAAVNPAAAATASMAKTAATAARGKYRDAINPTAAAELVPPHTVAGYATGPTTIEVDVKIQSLVGVNMT